MLIRKKTALIVLLILALLSILAIYNREVIKNYIDEVVTSPSTRVTLINIAKVVIPLKNLILMRNVDDKIALLESSGSCVFCDLTQGNFKGRDLKGVDLRYANLSGADLSNTNLIGADLSNTNLSGIDFWYKDLTGTILIGANFSGTNLDGVDLRNKNLTGVNLSGVDLRNMDFTGANLSGVDLRNMDLTGTILKEAKKIKISFKNPDNSNWPAINEVQNLNVTRYDLRGDVQYLATKEGFLFESKDNELKLVLDLNKNAQFPFYDDSFESGFLGVASKNKIVYVSYSSQDINGVKSLVVDEYSINFTKVRNIIKIEEFDQIHYGGSLSLDSLGKLYLSVGDGGPQSSQGVTDTDAQNLNSYKGKILRLDTSNLKKKPQIIAYGIRNPWGVTIDSKNRMFILQCGYGTSEAAYLLNDLYPSIPVNLGWPVFEGSVRVSYDLTKKKDPLSFNNILAPIYETDVRPGCLTGGVYLDDIELFLFSDFSGTLRLLKQKENGEWYLFHEDKQEKGNIWGLGLDKKTKRIFIAPNNLELEILIDQVKLN